MSVCWVNVDIRLLISSMHHAMCLSSVSMPILFVKVLCCHYNSRQTDKYACCQPTRQYKLNIGVTDTLQVPKGCHDDADFLVSYRELGPLFHNLIPQHSRGNRPLLIVLAPSRIRYGAGAAGVLYGGLQSPVHPGPWHRALEGWWCPAPAASLHAAGFALET